HARLPHSSLHDALPIYDENPPTLNRIGGKSWQAAKKRAQRAIAELADELLELYAARELVDGHAFSSDGEWMAELEASFPYQETRSEEHTSELQSRENLV